MARRLWMCEMLAPPKKLWNDWFFLQIPTHVMVSYGFHVVRMDDSIPLCDLRWAQEGLPPPGGGLPPRGLRHRHGQGWGSCHMQTSPQATNDGVGVDVSGVSEPFPFLQPEKVAIVSRDTTSRWQPLEGNLVTPVYTLFTGGCVMLPILVVWG